MTEEATLIEFPCDFAIKIIGISSDTFISDITAIVLSFYPDTPAECIISKPSEKGNYTAVTATVHTLDKPTLDALYQALTNHPDMKMVL